MAQIGQGQGSRANTSMELYFSKLKKNKIFSNSGFTLLSDYFNKMKMECWASVLARASRSVRFFHCSFHTEWGNFFFKPMLRCHSSCGCLCITRHSCIGDGGGGLMTSDSLRVLPQQVTCAPMDCPTPGSVWAAQTEGQGQDRKLGRAGEDVGSAWRSEVFGYMLCPWHSQKCNKNIILKTSAAHLCASLFLYKKNSFNSHEWLRKKYYCYFQITWKETNEMKLISDKAVSAQIEWSRLRASGLSASWLEEMEHLAIHVCNISCRQPPALPDFILLLCLSPSSFVHIPHVHLLFSLSSSREKCVSFQQTTSV